MRIRRALALSVASVLAAAGCASAHDGSLVVFAASSLTSAFTVIGAEFTAAHRAPPVSTSFAGSADLLAQLTGGAPADVLATADTATMDRAAAAGLLGGRPVTFATNTLTIVVQPGNPKAVNGFDDHSRVSLVVCAPQVPCGSALPGIAAAGGVPLNPVSEESSVTDVLGKVTSGQADAGIVYATDALAADGRHTAVPFPSAAAAVNTYRIAVLAAAVDPVAAAEFIETVTGARGREILAAAGFGPP